MPSTSVARSTFQVTMSRSCAITQLLIGTTGFDERLQPSQLPAEHSVDDRGDVAKTAGAEASDRVNQFDRRSAAGLRQVPRHRPDERRFLQGRLAEIEKRLKRPATGAAR